MDRAAAIYCVADSRYFLGAVGLVNSLRLLGHDEPILMLDCGLSDDQRRLLEPEVTVVAAPGQAPPWLTKTVLPLSEPADAMLLLDTDMIATRSLGPLFERAQAGEFVVFANPLDRWVADWGDLLGLGPARRGKYVSSAAIGAGGAPGRELLGLLDEHQRVVEFERTYWRKNEPDYAFTFADQDVLNAILATRPESDQIEILEERLSPTPPFDGLEIVDEPGLRCAYPDGVEPFLVHHHIVRPWLEQTEHGVYSRMLRRLLIGDDVAIRVGGDALPPWLRSGARARVMRARHDASARLRRRS